MSVREDFEFDVVAQVSLGEETKVHRGAHMSLGEDFEVDGEGQVSPEVTPGSFCSNSSKIA